MNTEDLIQRALEILKVASLGEGYGSVPTAQAMAQIAIAQALLELRQAFEGVAVMTVARTEDDEP